MKALQYILVPVSSFNAATTVAARNIAASLVAVMTAIILLQVFFRYVLDYSFVWSEELAKILMVWTAFLVAPWAYRVGANVSIELFRDSFPRRLQLVSQLFLNVLVIWIVALYLLQSIDFWLAGFAVTSASMPVAMGWFYAVVPLGFAGVLIVGIELIIRGVLGLLDPDADYIVPGAGTPMEGE